MPEINGITIMMSIQAVDSKISELAAQLENDERRDEDDSDEGEVELLLLSYEKALANLKNAYEEALKTSSNLPPYNQLIRA